MTTSGAKAARPRRTPEYLSMLAGILVSYAVIIVFGETSGGNAARVALLGFLLVIAARLHSDRRWWHVGVLLGVTSVIGTAIVAITAPSVVSGVVGGCSTVLLGVAIASTISSLSTRPKVDTASVLGVLCIYLLLALFFGGVHQLLAAFQSPYLNGVGGGRPTASDLVYFSVITITTVGFGDITPASEVARAVTVVEALTGQLYLVSVVAGVVSLWRDARDH